VSPDLLNPKSIGFSAVLRTTIVPKFVIPTKGFRYIVLIYTSTHPHAYPAHTHIVMLLYLYCRLNCLQKSSEAVTRSSADADKPARRV